VLLVDLTQSIIPSSRHSRIVLVVPPGQLSRKKLSLLTTGGRSFMD